jgi:hypothetical protein
VLFLADGRIVRDLGRSSAHEILATLEEMQGEAGDERREAGR